MNLKHEITKLLEQLASERPTPMACDTLWPEDPAPVEPYSDQQYDEAWEDHIERARRLRRPE